MYFLLVEDPNQDYILVGEDEDFRALETQAGGFNRSYIIINGVVRQSAYVPFSINLNQDPIISEGEHWGCSHPEARDQ